MVPRVLSAVVLAAALGTFACAPVPSDPLLNAEGVSANANLEISGNGQGPQACPQDSKLIGLVSVFGSETEASWWRLTYNGMIAAGLTTSDQQLDYLNGVFGTSFATLAEVRLYSLQPVSSYDKNQNGFVCAYEVRGTKAWITDPLFEYTYFGISDDRIR